MTEIDRLLSMLGLDKLSDEKQKEVKELMKKIISKWRNGNNEGAYSVFNSMLKTMDCDNLPQSVLNEIKDKFYDLLAKEAGFSKNDFVFEYGGVFNNPTVYDIKETTATGDAVGPDSNRQGDAYSKVIGTDGLQRRKPQKRDYDESEAGIIDKLEKLKQLFLNRNSKSITIDMIKKVLSEEDEEQILSTKQYLNEALKMANVVSEDKVLNYYFSESSPLTSTFNHTAWSGFKYIRLSKTGIVIHSTTHLAQVGTKMTKEKQDALQGMGIKIIISEGLNEAFQANDNILDDMTYDELLTTVLSNVENPDEKSIMKEFDKLLTMKIKDAKFEIRKAVKQIIQDLK